jgi:hypothetical protein
MKTGYDPKTDKLLDAATEYGCQDFVNAAIAFLDQAGCTARCQNQVAELIAKNLDLAAPMELVPKQPRALTPEEQVAMDRVSNMSRTAAMNSQGVRNLDKGRRGPITKPNDRVPGSMAEGDRVRGVRPGQDPAEIRGPVTMPAPSPANPNPTWGQAQEELKTWRKETEAKQKAEIEEQKKGRKAS